MATTTDPLPPGSTIGILGSGQLGRMLAKAAARLGLRSHVYCNTSGPAFDVAAARTVAAFDDARALDAFAAAVDVVTFEFENVPVETVRQIARRRPVRPGPLALEVAQDRLTEKTFIGDLGVPVAPFVAVAGPADLAAAAAAIDSWEGASGILKTRRLGYDGKGQMRVEKPADLAAALRAIGSVPAVLERRLAFTREISALIVRADDGSSVIYDVPENEHGGGILRRSTVPARIDGATAAAARSIATRIADALGYVGCLAVEMFELGEAAHHRLIVNEIAPRVHNSGHWTMDACAVSQFENHVRAVAGWPLAATDRHSDVVMENLIGADVERWRQLAREPATCLHLYGKRDARPGRKMGHVNRLSPRTAG